MTNLEMLQEYLAKLAGGGLCIAFSGGVDSALLLKAACLTGERVYALTMYTPFHSPVEPEHAARLAAEYGAEHHVLTLEEMPENVMKNPPNRCYLCKGEIFGRIRDFAREKGAAWVLDGTNADDLGQYRPGLRALRELEIKSPLAELGLTKAQVREMAAELGLSVAAKPSAPCLATRFPYGTALDPEELQRVDEMETYLRSLGFSVVRVRVHSNILRIETPVEDLAAVTAHYRQIVDNFKARGYDYVTLDLEGFRSGSMDLDPVAGARRKKGKQPGGRSGMERPA